MIHVFKKQTWIISCTHAYQKTQMVQKHAHVYKHIQCMMSKREGIPSFDSVCTPSQILNPNVCDYSIQTGSIICTYSKARLALDRSAWFHLIKYNALLLVKFLLTEGSNFVEAKKIPNLLNVLWFQVSDLQRSSNIRWHSIILLGQWGGGGPLTHSSNTYNGFGQLCKWFFQFTWFLGSLCTFKHLTVRRIINTHVQSYL